MSELLPEDLVTYYKRLYPTHLMVQWLSYAPRPGQYFANREFSMTLPDDIYIRFLSFNDESEFRSALLEKRPEKLDIGAVYNCRPKERATVSAGAFQPTEKELVLDIDLTDYDGVRLCCSEARVCSKCWLYMRIAVKVLDRALREDFGFTRLLWVYSGRRGIHCWVCDKAARQLSNSARSAVVEYLSLVAKRPKSDRQQQQQQQQSNSSESQVPKCHPSVTAACNLIRADFPTLAEQQDLFGTEDRCRSMLSMLPEDMRAAAEPVATKWFEDPDAYPSAKRWKAVSRFAHKSCRVNIEQELLIHFAYPRLDVGVSTGLNHLLKAPFCVHPKTGRICVPFDPKLVDTFDPESVPALCHILDQLDSGGTSQQMHQLAYKSTSLRDSIELFAKFVESLKSEWPQSEAPLRDAANVESF